jgi:hypothetical protein
MRESDAWFAQNRARLAHTVATQYATSASSSGTEAAALAILQQQSPTVAELAEQPMLGNVNIGVATK